MSKYWHYSLLALCIGGNEALSFARSHRKHWYVYIYECSYDYMCVLVEKSKVTEDLFSAIDEL